MYYSLIGFGRYLRKMHYKISVLVILLAVVSMSGWYGASVDIKTVNSVSRPVTDLAEKTKQTAVTTSERSVDNQAKQKSDKTQQEESVDSNKSANFSAGQDASVSLSHATPPLVLLAAIAIWLFWIRRPDVVVKDSDEFIGALQTWHKLIVEKQTTPRSIKRFMNRVRFFAMHHQSLGGKEFSHLRIWLAKKITALKFLVKKPTAEHEGMSESMLVAMSALHHASPEWLENKKIVSIKDDVLEQFLNTETKEDLESHEMQVLKASIQDHITQFGQWPPTENQLKQFRKISEGIHVN